jgi:hypothetical protein
MPEGNDLERELTIVRDMNRALHDRQSQFCETLTSEQAAWMRAWIERKSARLLQWQRQPEGRDCLALLSLVRPSLLTPLLPELACSYLHMVWDAPMSLASSFEEFPHLPLDFFRRVYWSSAGMFEAWVRDSFWQSLPPPYARVLRPLVPDAALHGLVNWSRAHRASAWRAGELLYMASDRTALEKRLWEGLENSTRELFRTPSLIVWMRRLPLAHDLMAETSS